MRRVVTIGSLWAGLTWMGPAAAEEDAPALAPPAPGPVAAEPGPADLPPPIEAAPAPRPGAILAVPGMPIPGRSGARTTLPPLEPAGPASPDDLPPLIGPAQSPDSPPVPPAEARPMFPGNPPGGVRRPGVIESTPNPTGEGIPRTPALRRDPSRTVPHPARRSPGFLGRFLAPYGPGAGRPAAEPDDSIRVEPRSDPATDAALKRRIEHQIRSTLGDRLKTFDVRVKGRQVIVHARVARFWQRRNVRRSIEELPALSGLRPTLDVE